MNWRKIKKFMGQTIKVVFDDHADGVGIVKCSVTGELRDVDQERLILCKWAVLNEDEDTCALNEEHYTIVIGAIKDIQIPLAWESIENC